MDENLQRKKGYDELCDWFERNHLLLNEEERETVSKILSSMLAEKKELPPLVKKRLKGA